MWKPGSGSPNRDAVFVDVSLRDEFLREWRRIDRTWSGRFLEADAIGVFPMIQAERDLLRAAIRKLAPSRPGPCLVPV